MWLLPSRQRPGNVRRFFGHYQKTGATSPGVLIVDSDDIRLGEYQALKLPENWRLHVGYNQKGDLSKILNDAYARYPGHTWYGVMGDDHIPITPMWDFLLIEAAGVDFIAYPDDGINGPNNCCTPAIGCNAIKRMGFLALPGAKRLYQDNAWLEFGKKHGILKYMPGVKIDHWHFSTGKSPRDEVYRKPSAQADKAVFEAWKANL